MSSSYKKNPSRKSHDDYETPKKRCERCTRCTCEVSGQKKSRGPRNHYSRQKMSGNNFSGSKMCNGYTGRQNSPHKRQHGHHLCDLCDCANPKASHKCPPKKRKYPKDMKTTMRNDYDKVRGWINPNGKPNEFVPRSDYKKSQPLRDNYDTVYHHDYIGSAPGKQQNYKPREFHATTAPFVGDTTYKNLTRSAKKGGYSPLKRQKRRAKPTSGFEDNTIYHKDYQEKELSRGMREHMGNTNKEIFGGTTNHRGAGPMEDQTIYRDDYVEHESDSNNVYVLDPFKETSLPKPKHMMDKTVYMNDYVPKKGKKRVCPLDNMPEVPGELRNEGGCVYFDADYDEWYTKNGGGGEHVHGDGHGHTHGHGSSGHRHGHGSSGHRQGHGSSGHRHGHENGEAYGEVHGHRNGDGHNHGHSHGNGHRHGHDHGNSHGHGHHGHRHHDSERSSQDYDYDIRYRGKETYGYRR